MLSRFVWNLIRPHLLQVLEQHDANMKSWIYTDGCAEIDKTIQKSCNKITDDISHIVSQKIDNEIEYQNKARVILRNEIDRIQEELEDKTSAELQRLSDRLSIAESNGQSQAEIIHKFNRMVKELDSIRTDLATLRLKHETLYNVMKNGSDMIHCALATPT